MADEPSETGTEAPQEEEEETEQPEQPDSTEPTEKTEQVINVSTEDATVDQDGDEDEGDDAGTKSQNLSASKLSTVTSPKSKSSRRNSPKLVDSRPRSGRSSIYAPDHPLPLGAGQGNFLFLLDFF